MRFYYTQLFPNVQRKITVIPHRCADIYSFDIRMGDSKPWRGLFRRKPAAPLSLPPYPEASARAFLILYLRTEFVRFAAQFQGFNNYARWVLNSANIIRVNVALRNR